MLLQPSVSRTMTFDFDGWLAQPVHAHGNGVADGRAVGNRAGVDPLEPLVQPVVIERQRADQIGLGREFDQADAVIGTRVDEFRDGGLDRVDAATSAGRSPYNRATASSRKRRSPA